MVASNDYVLAADIGGTNTRLACYKIEEGQIPQYMMGAVFSSKGNHLAEQLNQTLSLAEHQLGVRITKACFAVAGVINAAGDHADFANLDWNLDCQPLIDATFLEKIILLNDFEALGFGINFLDEKNEEDLLMLPHPDGYCPNGHSGGTKILVGAGTGLGHGILVYSSDKELYFPVHSEGSHVDFAATNKLEWELVEYLRDHVCQGRHPCYETVASGPGLVNVYNFLLSREQSPGPAHEAVSSAVDKAAAVSINVDKDPFCRQAMDLFLLFYARAAKNLALTCMATGGLYIGGGIAPKILPLIQKSSFVKDFEEAGSIFHIDVLKETPVRVILNQRTALNGAAVWGSLAG